MAETCREQRRGSAPVFTFSYLNSLLTVAVWAVLAPTKTDSCLVTTGTLETAVHSQATKAPASPLLTRRFPKWPTPFFMGDRGDAVEGEHQRLVCLGLPNLGQTCYMNATLQCLFHLPSFCEDISRQEEYWRLVPSADLLRHVVGVSTLYKLTKMSVLVLMT